MHTACIYEHGPVIHEMNIERMKTCRSKVLKI